MYKTLSTGVAMFAMLFGAGNVAFPLALGRESGNTVGWSIIGFCITAVLVPLFGLVSIMLYNGDYRVFLGRIGSIPGLILTGICMILVGPFGAIPRCINMAYAATKWYFPTFPLLYFSITIAHVIFFSALKQGNVVDLIGKFLGPLKLFLLFGIITIGLFWMHGTLSIVNVSIPNAIIKGAIEGYGTMDLLGTIFFAGLIVQSLKKNTKSNGKESDSNSEEECKNLAIRGLRAGIVGAILLGSVYAGFCLVAAMHGPNIENTDKYELLNSLAPYILGKHGGVLTNFTIGVSCFVTALALTVVFSEYLQKTVFKGNINYTIALLATVITSCLMSNLGFNKIMSLISPIIAACYPALIVLSAMNMMHKLFQIHLVKLPVFLTLAGTLITMYFQS